MRRVTLFLVVILFWSIVPISAVSAITDPNHNPIEIIGDESFTPENGVIGGSGTPEDPYIIANWVINASGSAFGIHIANTRAYFVIRNVTIYEGSYGIYLENVTNFVIQYSTIHHVQNDAIEIQESANGLIKNNIIYNASTGIKLTDWNNVLHMVNHDITISDNHIFDITWYGVEINDLSSNNTVSRNIIENTRDDGIFVWSAGYGNRILNNTIRNTVEAGIYIGYTNGTEIAYNTIYGINGYGIGIGRGNHNDIHDNTISNNSYQGIYIHHSTDNEIYRNNLENNLYEGILLYIGTYNTLVHDNNMINNGFGVYSWGSNITITYNFFQNNSYSGISLRDCKKNTVSENTIINIIYGDGIYIWNATENVIANNHIEGTGEDGVQLQYSPNNIVVDNYIEHGNVNTAQGIDAHHSPYLMIQNNTITNANNGIYLFLDSHGANITGNIIFNNGAGIVIEDSDTMKISKNTLTNNSRQAVVVVNSQNITLSENHVEGSGYNGVEFYNVVSGLVQHNYFFNNNHGAFQADNSTVLIVTSNTMISTKTGVALRNATHNVTVRDNIILNNEKGFWIWEADGVEIYNNTISSSGWTGVFLYCSLNISIEHNTLSNNQGDGILIESTNKTRILNNVFSENQGAGISIGDSKDNIVRENTFESNDIGINIGGSLNIIVMNNSILNSKYPAIEVHNSEILNIQLNYVYGTNHTGIWLWNATSIVIENNTVFNSAYEGIWGQYVYNSTIKNNNLQNNEYSGVTLVDSEDSIVSRNTFDGNGEGVKIEDSVNITVIDNNLLNSNHPAIEIKNSENLKIQLNYVYATNHTGIWIRNATSITIENNTVVNSTYEGIWAQYIYNSRIKNNNLENNGYDAITLILASDVLVNENIMRFNGAGFAGINSTNLHVVDNYVENANAGILLTYGIRNSTVQNNFIINNEKGFWIWEASNNTFVNNTVLNSGWTGVFIYNSTSNVFYLNHFENSQNVVLENSVAQWYSPEPISYDYNGTTIIIPGTQFTNYLGNYWSNYIGRDTNGDGIGEEPYYIDSNNYDPYPISYMIKPVVLTDIAREITNTSAVFKGTLLDTGGSTSVEVWFEYGLSSDNLTQITSHQVLPTEGSFEIGVFDLVPNTTYYFRAVAKNEIGTAYGRILSFTTPLTGNYTTLQRGPASDLIRITLTTSEEGGILDTAAGRLDIFLQDTGPGWYQSLPQEVLANLSLIKITGIYTDIELNPVHETNSTITIINNKTYFNPLAIRDIRYALNFLISRDHIVQNVLNGYGQPMFGGIRPSTGASRYFEPVYNTLGLSSGGNENKALIMIDEAMQKATQELTVQGYILEKVNGTWYFEGEPVTLKFIIRVEDERKDIGLYIADLLEKAGFKVDRLLWDRRKASSTVYAGDPKNYQWNIYTGGWVSTINIKWPDDYTAWWYTSWYGWLPAAVGWEMPKEDLITFGELVNELGGANATIIALQLKYYNTPDKLAELYDMTVEEITKMIVLGSVEFNGKTYELNEGNVEQYWDLQKISMALGVRDSQKVFLAETWKYFPVNKERVLNIAADVSSGLWTRWSLITAETPDKILKVAEFPPIGKLFMSSFNPIGGIQDVYSASIWRVVSDPALYPDLTTGIYIPVRCEYTIERSNITVPSTAVIYNSTTDQWVAVHTGEPAKAKITYNCKLSNWHDGEPMSIADVKYIIAFYYEWANKDSENDPYYDDKLASRMQSTLANIKGIEWIDNDTYVVYTDNVHPIADDVTANMNVFWPLMPWQLYYAMGELIAKANTYGIETIYSFNSEDGTWLDLLNSMHVSDLRKVVEVLKASNSVPAAIAGDVSDPTTGYDAILNWINSKDHAVISNGPFYLDYYDPDDLILELRAFRDPTYPFTLEEIKQMIGMGDYSPPTIMDFEINPSIVEVGNSTVISWMVADESQITEVTLTIEEPNGTILTETFDPSVGVYSYEYNVSDVGTYTVTVKSVDKWGNTNELSMEFYGQKTILETITVNETTSNVTVQEEDLELNIDVNETAISKETQIVINATITTNEEDILNENASTLAVAPVVANTTENETQSVAAVKYVIVDASTTDGNTTTEDIVEKYTLKLSYDEAELGTIDESTLSLYYWNGSSWIRVTDYVNSTIPNGPFVYDAGVNTEENYVWAVVDHFSVYALGGVSKPITSITSPEEGAEFYTNTTVNVTITWEAEDKLGIDHYEIKLNDGPWIRVGSNEYTFYELSKGEYTVWVKAINLAGQYSEDMVTFKVTVLTVEEQKEIIEKLKEWEEAYFMYLDMFEAAYNQATELGIDNETLKLALEYKQIAQEYYLQAKEIGYTPKAVPYMRHAVVRMRKGYEVLEQAIRQKQKKKK